MKAVFRLGIVRALDAERLAPQAMRGDPTALSLVNAAVTTAYEIATGHDLSCLRCGNTITRSELPGVAHVVALQPQDQRTRRWVCCTTCAVLADKVLLDFGEQALTSLSGSSASIMGHA